jgi:hypothetical protein
MTTTKIDYKKIFELFVSQDGLDELITHPFKQKEMQYATDRHSLIRLPVEKVDLDFAEQDKPNAGVVIPKETNCNIEIKIADIELQLIPDLIDETVEEKTEKKCTNSDCEEGVVECEYGHDHDCPICNGNGTTVITVNVPTGKKIPVETKKFRLLGVGFMYKQLRRFIDACKLMEVEIVRKTFGTINGANLFKCGDATILVMPALIDEDSEVEVTEIKL